MGAFFLYLVIVIAIFLLFREVNCWYFKINDRISLEKERNELLKKILAQLGGKIDEVTVKPQQFMDALAEKPKEEKTVDFDPDTEQLCPYCSKAISKRAKACRHCNRWLPGFEPKN